MIANAVAKSTEHLTGLRKAAIFLIMLGDKASAEIIKLLSEDEVQIVSREIARLESISSENAEALLEEFYQMNMAHDFVVRGGLDYAKKMLNQAFGPEVAKRLIDRLAKSVGGEYASLDELQKVDPQQLAKFIHNEHPQTIALVLSHLNASQAAALLVSLPPEMRSDVALRMGALDQISPEIVNKIATVIGKKLKSIGEYSRESYGGIRAVAEMFNRLDSGTSKEILATIEAHNPNLVETIRHLMFVFEDMMMIDAIQLKDIIGRVDRKVITLALKGTSDQLRDHFFTTMSARGAEMMKEELESLGPVRIKEVETAQQQIIAIVRQLEAEGVITMKGTVGEQYVV
ncbi:MAG TPA: flagellar motor switch protein FliG [Bryobacteraceae bacterium]|jgi:flagellar motor switch protein FliG|nr:flagellar motor switch protein FliG [Bryobacteraceae bacterium]